MVRAHTEAVKTFMGLRAAGDVVAAKDLISRTKDQLRSLAGTAESFSVAN